MDLEPARESFILYAKWYTCISAFSAKAQGLAFKAICEYALFDIPIPKVGFSHLEYNSLISFLPVIDSNRRRYENGKKGAVHGFKGGRPRKDVALKTPNQTPNETPSQTPNETPNETPNGNVYSEINNNVDVNVNAELVVAPTAKNIYNLLLPIFFFRNCDAQHEVRRFYKHYRLAEWRLTGGDLLNTPKRLVIAAERWKVEDTKPYYPSGFIVIWRKIYEMAPAELKQDILEISASTRMQTSISIVCSSNLCRWLGSPEMSPCFIRLQQDMSYRIDLVHRKDSNSSK